MSDQRSSQRLLFVMKHPGVVRNLEPALRTIAEEGHEVRLVFESVKTVDSEETARRLARELPSLSIVSRPTRRSGPWSELARSLRQTADYLRYLEPMYAEATKLRARAARDTPLAVRRAFALPILRGAASVGIARRIVRRLERAMPPPGALESFLRAQDPGLVLVAPLVGIASAQADWIRAARRLGIRTCFPVYSWDNLTNKGVLRDEPDRVVVWNASQADEAVSLHGVAEDRIVVTGAAPYDKWFGRAPARDRRSFCDAVGLDPERPLVLYVCSSPFIAPDEVSFVKEWLDHVRRHDTLGEVGVLVRPHPQNATQWAGETLDPQARIWPLLGEDPLDAASQDNYFDSMYHADAVIGINTSALIEGAVVGRPVLTVVTDTFRETQEGTLHFGHLTGESGHLVVAHDLDEHVSQLAAALGPGGFDAMQTQRFVGTFVRPHGLDRAATPFVVAAILSTPATTPRTHGDALLLTLLRPVAVFAHLRHATRRRRSREEREASRARNQGRDDALTAASSRLRDLARLDEQPVIAGPWLAEVGYELLYWIPFLRLATARHPELRDRLVTVSRGGVSSWYEGICEQYLELYDLVSPKNLQERLAAVADETGGYRKQFSETSLDAELLGVIKNELGVRDVHVLHPSLMFRAYRQLMKARLLPGAYDRHFLAAPLAPPRLELPDLPDDFVALRVYFRNSLPDTVRNRRTIEEIVDALAATTDVVVLTPPGSYDEHVDFSPAAHSRVHRLDHRMTPSTNLGVQTAVLAQARGFVGTYGGFAYLPALLGKPTVSLYSEPLRFRPHHLEAAQRLSRIDGCGSFTALHVDELDLLRSLLAGDTLSA